MLPVRSAALLAGCALGLVACGSETTAVRANDLGAPIDAPSDVVEAGADLPVLDDAPDASPDDVALLDATPDDAAPDAAPDVAPDAAPDAPDASVRVALAGPCTDTADAVYVTPAGLPPMTPERRGDVVRCTIDPAQDLAAVNANMRAANVEGVTAMWPVDVYRVAFRTLRDETTGGMSSARVYLPHGAVGPRPLVVVAHPSEGLADSCATSRHADSMRELALPWASQGYPVIAPDLAGLGTDGTQGYLDNRDSAQSLLDGARALRRLLAPGSLSSRIILVGYSQGGGVVIAAQGLVRSYGADGDVAAAVVYAPQWPSRLNAFQVTSSLRAPDALTITWGITTPVAVSSMAYVFFENHLGRGRGGDAFPAATRSATVGAINSLCLVAYGGFVQGTQLHVRDWLEPALRASFLACLDDPSSSDCFGVGRDFYQYVHANVDTYAGGDPEGAPIFYVQGMLDTIMPPAQEAACNLLRLQRARVNVEVCTDDAALHSSVVERNVRHAMAWATGRLEGRTVPPCTGPALPSCTP